MPLRETSQPRTPEADLARASKDLEWKHEIAARLQSGIQAQQTPTPAEGAFKWFKADPNEPPAIVEARRVVNGPTYPQNDVSPEGVTQPNTSNVEVERTLRAIRSLKEETDTGFTGLSRKTVVNLK
jgi:hypothetical protein